MHEKRIMIRATNSLKGRATYVPSSMQLTEYGVSKYFY